MIAINTTKMWRGTITIYVTLLMVTGALASRAADEQPMRTWTSSTGATVEGQFSSFDDGMVNVKMEDGKVMTIGITDLSSDDQAYVKKIVGKAAAAAIPPEPRPDLLPILKDSSWKQIRHGKVRSIRWKNAHYSGQDFEAWVSERGTLHIQPKVKKVEGQFQETINCGIAARYTDDKRNTRHRKLIKFIDPPAAKRNPQEVAFTMEFDSGVIVEVSYKFYRNRVVLNAELTEPDDIEYRTAPRLSIGIPRSHVFPQDITLEEAERLTAGCELEIERLSGDESEHSYYDGKSLRGHFKTVTIKGHWRGREVVIEPGNRHGGVWLYNYSGNPPFMGYGIYSQASAGADCPKEVSEVEIKVR
ncbi:MAG: hypothetical protein K9N51_12180 [Candidatus Pacebacteria bacterium]|nr:hypothetical protein [Candidatus Paceibacterota bacterium]